MNIYAQHPQPSLNLLPVSDYINSRRCVLKQNWKWRIGNSFIKMESVGRRAYCVNCAAANICPPLQLAQVVCHITGSFFTPKAILLICGAFLHGWSSNTALCCKCTLLYHQQHKNPLTSCILRCLGVLIWQALPSEPPSPHRTWLGSWSETVASARLWLPSTLRGFAGLYHQLNSANPFCHLWLG